MIPAELSHVVLPASVPVTAVDASSETIRRLVDASIAPLLSRAATKSRLTPGTSAWVFDQVPWAVSRAAASPLTTTRVDPASVLDPDRITKLDWTRLRNGPPLTAEEAPDSFRSAIWMKSELFVAALSPRMASTCVPGPSRAPTGP